MADEATPEAVDSAVTEASAFAPIDLDSLTVEGEPEGTPPAESEETEADETTAPPEEASGDEAAEEAEAAPEEPPIEPPRSWNAEERERFKSFPRETQEYLVQREQERDRAFNQRQNELSEKLRGLSTKEQTAEQARQQYEAALPQLLQVLESQQASDFADIKSIQDVERLAREDWPRYLQWDVAQKKKAAIEQEIRQSHQRQSVERQQKFAEFAQSQDNLFKERVPEMAQPETASKLQQQALSVLHDLGFRDEELVGSWNGEKDISLRDHRMQMLIRDAALWRDSQQKAKAITPKPQPKPQRPGPAPTRPSNVVNLQTAADSGDMEAFIKMRKAGKSR